MKISLLTVLLLLNIYFVNPVEASFFYPWLEKLSNPNEDTDSHAPKDTKISTEEQSKQKSEEQKTELSYSQEIYRGENPNTKEEAMHILREQEKEQEEQLPPSQFFTRGLSSVTSPKDLEYKALNFLAICDWTIIAIPMGISYDLNHQNNNYPNKINQLIVLKYLRKRKKVNNGASCSQRIDEGLSQYCCWKDNTSIEIW